MKESILKSARNIHFIGIGGIGISAIARMLLLEGKNVSGSDMSDSSIIDELKKAGAKILIGHNSKNLPKNTDLIIYTIAINDKNEEFIEAKRRKIKMITYPESLKEISKDKYTIAISGTHGKTTTTAMIAKIMLDAGLDPTVIVGSLLKDVKSNFIAGKSKYFLVEACEYRKSFLNINPTITIVTNIDNDHLDYYKDINDIQTAFCEFIHKVPKKGYIICNPKDKIVAPILTDLQGTVIDCNEFEDEKIELKIPGKHNIKNAEMALATAHLLGIDKQKALESLKGFLGTWRRFEYKGVNPNGVIIYDDYGHHPTEIKATLCGAREFFGNKEITVVFQPHLYSRTKILFNDFIEAFGDADNLVISPIYSAREVFDPTISSDMLAKKIQIKNKVMSLVNFREIEKYLKSNLKKGDILITIGAGDVYKIGENLLK